MGRSGPTSSPASRTASSTSETARGSVPGQFLTGIAAVAAVATPVVAGRRELGATDVSPGRKGLWRRVHVRVGRVLPLSAIEGFFLKAYLEKRKGDREDRNADRESESGIVETTKEALRIARDQMAQMEADTKVLRSRVSRLESRLRMRESQLPELEATLRAKDEGARHLPNRAVPSQRASPPDAAKDLPKRSGLSQSGSGDGR